MTNHFDEKEIEAIVKKFGAKEDALISILQEVQRKQGFLSEQTVLCLSGKLNLPAGQIYGVASYYKVFRTEPGGREEIKVCDGTSCHLKGAGELIARLKRELKVEEGEPTEDQRYTLEKVRCQGYCQIGPALKINEAVHGPVTQEKAIKLIKEQR